MAKMSSQFQEEESRADAFLVPIQKAGGLCLAHGPPRAASILPAEAPQVERTLAGPQGSRQERGREVGPSFNYCQ